MTEPTQLPEDERDLIHRLNTASATEMVAMLRRPTPADEQTFRTYLGDERYERMHTLALRRSATRGITKLGNVMVIHGIMGGELTAIRTGKTSGSKIWLNYLQLALGRFMWFKLQSDGVRDADSRQALHATGIIQKFYGELTLSLSESWNAIPFWYDWRKDIYRSANELQLRAAEAFGRGVPFHIVAHSMGGLVARTFIRQNREAWTAMQKDGARQGGRLIMLGTPNYGSFAVPQIITGLEGIIRKLDFIDTRNDRSQYVTVANTFTGSYQMMPSTTTMPEMARLYEAQTWQPTDVSQSLLDLGRAFHEDIDGVKDEWMSYVAGYGQHTLNGVADWERLHEQAGYTATKWDGDGRVPHKLGLLGEGAGRVFYVKESHADLPLNRAVQLAAGQLLVLGKNDALDVQGISASLPAQREADPDAETAAAEREQRIAQEIDELNLHAYWARGTRAIPEVADLSADEAENDPAYVAVAENHRAEEVLVSGWLGHGPRDVTVPVVPLAERTVDAEHAEDIFPGIRVAVYRGSIESVHRTTEKPDAVAVGLYVGVRPDGAARALDRAVSEKMPGAHGRFITQMLERGVIQAGLGQPFILPDPRPEGAAGRVIALAGMGIAGRFGAPEATVMARELCWTLGRLGKQHLAAVLIGSGAGNMRVDAALESWFRGLARAQAGMPPEARLQRITFVERDRDRAQEIAAEIEAAVPRLSSIIAVEYLGVTQSRDPEGGTAVERRQPSEVPARVAFTYDKAAGAYRFGSITRTAALPERLIPLDRTLVDEANRLLASKETAFEQMTWGRFLERLLVPAEFRTSLETNEPLVMMLDDTTASIHWEMMASPGFDDIRREFDANAFLGTARGLTRQLRTTIAPPPEPPPPVRRRVRILLVADPAAHAPLAGAQIEGTRLAELFEEYNRIAPKEALEVVTLFGPVQARRSEVMMRLVTEQYDVVHFAGHCFYNTEHPEKSGWIFGKDEILTANEMNRIDRVPPFVFSNACESGVTPNRSNKDLPRSFAEAFFARGVTNFICTAWPISDEAATEFAVEVYRTLLGMNRTEDGPYILAADTFPLWTAMKNGRELLANHGAGRLTWGAYQHYGNPYYRLITRERSTTRSVRKATGGAPKPGAAKKRKKPARPARPSKAGARAR